MSIQTVLVLSATGTQGSEVTRQLLKNGHSVHALTRDPTSPASEVLHSAGAALFRGTFNDLDAITQAAKGCTALFLVITPTPTEAADAQTAITAALTAGSITKCVYSSVTNCDRIVHRAEFHKDMLRADYFLNKDHIQNLVMAGFPSWTILQPGAFMTNMMDPIGRFYFPRLGTEHVLHGAWKPEAKICWIDPVDIAKFAVVAVETGRFEHQKVPLAGDRLTVAELAAVMEEVSGQSVRAEYIGDEAVAAQRESNPLVVSADWTNQGWFDVDVEAVRALGIEMNDVRQFLTRQKESGELQKAMRAKLD